MNDLTFAQAQWFWGGLLLLPLLALRLRAHFQSRRRLTGLVSPRLAHRLVNGASQARRWVAFLLRSLALAFVLAALARPQWGYEEIESEVDARNLLIAIDTSRSMLSDDLAPNRLERAKLAAKDIILSLPDDRIGLLAFAGKPFLQAPLTTDHEAVLEAIDQIDTEIIPRGGTNLSAAAALAIDTMKELNAGSAVLVLFSDGEALEGTDEIEATRQRAELAGLGIITVGVGTAQGSIIPELDDEGALVPGAFVKDENGQVVRTRLVPESLQKISTEKGRFHHLGGPDSLTEVVDRIREGISVSREETETAKRPIERFLWPLSASVILLVLSHLLSLLWLKPSPAQRRPATKRRALVASALALLALPVPGRSVDPLRGGAEAFAREDFAGALSAYDDALAGAEAAGTRSRLQMGVGAAAYRLENFERAAEAYGQAIAEGDPELRSEAHYNLGNTLFRRGEAILRPGVPGGTDRDLIQALTSDPTDAMKRTESEWKGAIEHFEASLALDPDNPQAAHNRDYVKKRLEELEKQRQEQEKKDQEQQEQQQKEEEEKEKEKEQDEKKDNEDPNQDEQKKDGQNSPDSEGQKPPEDPGSDKGEDGKGQKPPPGDQSEEKNPKGDPKEQSPPDDSGEPNSDEPSKGDPPKPPGQEPADPPENPGDGKLEANPNQAQTPPPSSLDGDPADRQPNPKTGYSPSEARQLLDALADETEVRPLLAPSKGEKFKNW